jgi:hypothetical protein
MTTRAKAAPHGRAAAVPQIFSGGAMPQASGLPLVPGTGGVNSVGASIPSEGIFMYCQVMKSYSQGIASGEVVT